MGPDDGTLENMFCSEGFAVQLLNSSSDKFNSRGPCSICKRQCRWHNRLAFGDLKGVAKRFWVEVAGNTRAPWSKRGKMRGWLDPDSLPALVWAFGLKHRLGLGGPPNVIVNF